MVAILLKYNAVPNLLDKSNKSPKQIAQEFQNQHSTDIIEQLAAFDRKNRINADIQSSNYQQHNISTTDNSSFMQFSSREIGQGNNQSFMFKKSHISESESALRSAAPPRQRKLDLGQKSSMLNNSTLISIDEQMEDNPMDYLKRKLSQKNQNVPLIKQFELRYLEQISKGSSCLVYKGKWRQTEVAIKQFKIEYANNKKEMRKFVKEITALMKIRHPNLLLLMGVCLDGPQLSIVTEFCDNSSLFYVLHKNKNLKLSLLDRFFIGIQIARGIVYLHQSNPPIIHRDLKPENCLLDAAYSIKIADFGLARSQINDINPEDTQENTTLCIGTTRFMAPELFDKEKVQSIGCEIDIWSYGCLLIELFSGKRP